MITVNICVSQAQSVENLTSCRVEQGSVWRVLALPSLGWEHKASSALDFSPARDYCLSPEKGGTPSGQEYTFLPKPTQVIVCGPTWRFIKAIYEGGCG